MNGKRTEGGGRKAEGLRTEGLRTEDGEAAHETHEAHEKGRAPLWRDPAVEMPDDEITVVVRRQSNGAGTELRVVYHTDGAWLSTFTDEPIGGKVTGWCHEHEAIEILDKATREVGS